MSWVNYVVIPKWKLLVEVSNEVSRDKLEYDTKATEFLDTIMNLEEFNYDIFFKPLLQLTLVDLTEVIHTAKKIIDSLLPLVIDELLIYWLKAKDIEYDIISEFEYEERKKEFKGYKVIRID